MTDVQLTETTLKNDGHENGTHRATSSQLSQNSGPIDTADSMRSVGSDLSDDQKDKSGKKGGLFHDIITTENDLAGFSIAWTVGFVAVVILKLVDHEDVKKAEWSFICLIPIAICSLTWIFSYIITRYRKDRIKESMKIPAFILPFLCKLVIAIVLFGRLFYAAGGMRDRYESDGKYNGWCDCSIILIWINLMLSVVLTEIIITTVMVNSSQNLRPKIPKKVDFFLFLTRPSIWVYNRLIVMFLTFYVFYYVFGFGPLCTSQCRVPEVAGLSSIGVSIFTLPFKNVVYLFNWPHFDLTKMENAKDVQFAVIQQVLIITTILDLLMDIWSITQIFKRSEMAKMVNSALQTATIRGLRASMINHIPRESKINAAINEAIEEERKTPGSLNSPSDDDMDHELEQLDNIHRQMVVDNADKSKMDGNNDNNENEKKEEVGSTVIYEDDHNENGALSETEKSPSPSPRSPDDGDGPETPGYNKVPSESVQKKPAKERLDAEKRKYKIEPPKLGSIESGNM